jgi:glycosyltransferase involved in cell wall biosynthesis
VKLAIIGTDGLPARYGGFETFAAEMSPRLAMMGHDVRVVGSSVGRSRGEAAPAGVTVRNLPFRANGASSIPFDLASFANVCRWADGILLLGVSAGPFVPVLRRMTRSGNLIVNVDGLESRRAKWSPMGKHYLAFAERLAIQGARYVVADNQGIADIIAAQYQLDPAIIAYGNDHVERIDDMTRDAVLAGFGLSANCYLLTIARIEPENNIELMLEAIPRNDVRPYVVVGNFAASAYGQGLLSRYGDEPRVRLLPATYDPVSLAALRAGCYAYLHGHSVGGTNPSLVEILPYGRPVIAFECSFNRYTMDGHGGYFSSAAALNSLLEQGDFQRYTPPAKMLTDPRYQWKTIAERYAALFS